MEVKQEQEAAQQATYHLAGWSAGVLLGLATAAALVSGASIAPMVFTLVLPTLLALASAMAAAALAA